MDPSDVDIFPPNRWPDMTNINNNNNNSSNQLSDLENQLSNDNDDQSIQHSVISNQNTLGDNTIDHATNISANSPITPKHDIARYTNDDNSTNSNSTNSNSSNALFIKRNISSNIKHELFERLKGIFLGYSTNKQTINHSQLKRLINEFLEENDIINKTENFFVRDYIENIGDEFTLLDVYSVINHLKTVNDINGQSLQNVTDLNNNVYINKKKHDIDIHNIKNTIEYETAILDMERRKEAIAIEKEYRNTEKQFNIDNFNLDMYKKKILLKKEEKLIEYGNNVELYPKDSYGLTWYGCISKYCRNFCGQNTIKDFDKIYEIIKELPSLTVYEKNLILIRFHAILIYCTKHFNAISRFYNSTQIFLIACSIINPALLSINSNKDNVHYYTVFWSVWISQLLVSLITGYVSFFKWDKKYFLFNIYRTKINQEIWLFIGLTGSHYNSKNNTYNHAKYLHTFLNRIENLYRQLKTSEFDIETTKGEEENNSNNNNPKELIDIMQPTRVMQPTSQTTRL